MDSPDQSSGASAMLDARFGRRKRKRDPGFSVWETQLRV